MWQIATATSETKIYFESMSFKNYSIDQLEIFRINVKVYEVLMCAISKRSVKNCVFKNEKIKYSMNFLALLILGLE